MNADLPTELQGIYRERFAQTHRYRRKVWDVLVPAFFQKYVNPSDAVLDLGSGYGEFINAIRCGKKFAMDLNPDAAGYLDASVQFLQEDCSSRWSVRDGILNVVFTSNFFEHLPDKNALSRTLNEIYRCLARGGKLVAMGPNIKYVGGAYWDFWDHSLPLTESSLGEGLTNHGFEPIETLARFLPYTMVNRRELPLIFLKTYLRVPWAWRVFGKQFLVVSVKK